MGSHSNQRLVNFSSSAAASRSSGRLALKNGAMTRRPFVDLTYAVVDNCAAEILAQPQRPESKHWVGAAGRGSASQIRLCGLARCRKTGDEISRQKRRICRNAGDKGGVGAVYCSPIEPCQHPGEWPGEIGYAIGHDGQPKFSKAGGVAVGVEHECVNLRPQPLDNPFEQRYPAKHTQALVAAPHAPRLSACEQQADDLHAASSSTLAFRDRRGCSSSTVRRSPSKTMRLLPASATKRFPFARPMRVSPACRARSTPQAVKPEREIRIGMPICTVLITISEVSRPVV